MTRKEFEDGVRAELDRIRFYPRETDFQMWIENQYGAKLTNKPRPAMFREMAETFRKYHSGPSCHRRGRLPVAPEDF